MSMRPQSRGRDNKGLQLTKAARCAPLALRSLGQSLKAAFAADPRWRAVRENVLAGETAMPKDFVHLRAQAQCVGGV